MPVAQRVVVITGVSAGVGRAAVREFAWRGDRLVLSPEECELRGHEVSCCLAQAPANIDPFKLDQLI